jgi:hypothetical protein
MDLSDRPGRQERRRGVAALTLSLTGCGGSFQSEEAARALIEKEDAAMDIDAEIAEEQADAE